MQRPQVKMTRKCGLKPIEHCIQKPWKILKVQKCDKMLYSNYKPKKGTISKPLFAVKIETTSKRYIVNISRLHIDRFYGLMVMTPDFESGSPSSILGRTCFFLETMFAANFLYCTYRDMVFLISFPDVNSRFRM
jgi:hypothetical protein